MIGLKAEVEDGARTELIRVDLGFFLENLIEIFLLLVILVKKLPDAAKSVIVVFDKHIRITNHLIEICVQNMYKCRTISNPVS
jgi:hypothetical protein